MIKDVTAVQALTVTLSYKFSKIREVPFFTYNPNMWYLYIQNSNRIIWIYTGSKWQRLLLTKWAVGYKIRYFRWVKQVAIFKKKQFLKKK